MESFWETLLDVFIESREYREAAMIRRQKYLLSTLLLSTIPLWLVFITLVQAKLEERYKAHLKSRGIYYKEQPIEEIAISPLKDKKARYKNTISLTCKMKKVRTRDANAVATAHAENKKRKQELFKEVTSIIPKEEICLIARSGSVYAKRNDGEIKPEEERDRSFRLDLSHSWEKKKNDEWLGEHETILNNQGYAIAIRGVDEKTAELGYDIFIPDADEQDLCKMSLTELLKYCDAENCKLQIRENGSVFAYSDIPGYTKADVVKAIKETAERHGYKVKIKK